MSDEWLAELEGIGGYESESDDAVVIHEDEWSNQDVDSHCDQPVVEIEGIAGYEDNVDIYEACQTLWSSIMMSQTNTSL